ncbi:hypothetical protein OHA77_12280 [Streptosporangium sp. NBC_01639]|uniref:hypothetical protein n=1 Tax=Streptosporangium sp. NBC_01639 TaxID=2975948 RepID=UPI003863104B|nr:hypothetical protein OHA77_12280 [Streptosporangium sp. NBC_01639]
MFIRRAAVTALCSLSLLAGAITSAAAGHAATSGASVAQAGISSYTPACRAAVADARTVLRQLGRDPGTGDPKVVYQTLEDLTPVLSGQIAYLVRTHALKVQEECF